MYYMYYMYIVYNIHIYYNDRHRPRRRRQKRTCDILYRPRTPIRTHILLPIYPLVVYYNIVYTDI